MGYNELPASGNRIVCCIFVGIAQSLQSRNHHIIVGVLGKTQSRSGQFGSFHVTLKRSCFRNTQIDLGVNQFVSAGSFETQGRQQIERVISLSIHTAEHHALAVIALLDTHIKVAVLIKGEEEIQHQVCRSVKSERAAVQIRI